MRRLTRRRIRKWWSGFPYADIAWAVPPDVVVVDLDTKKGANGLLDFAVRHGMVADKVETPQATTPTGGRHLLFDAGGRIFKNTARVHGAAIDLRTEGGYIVLPGPGNGRQWAKPLATPLAPAPAWLPEKEEVEERPVGEAKPFSGEATPYARQSLNLACQAITSAPDGSQERTLNAEALGIGQLVAGGEIDQASAASALIAAGLQMTNYDPRRLWTEGAIRQKVARAMRDGAKSPRNSPSNEIDDETRAAIVGMGAPRSTSLKDASSEVADAAALMTQPNGPAALAEAASSGNLGEGVMRAVARFIELSRQVEAMAGAIVNVATLADVVPPPRYFIVDELIPCRTVTMLGGDGGTGKSLLALQLAIAVASATKWLGRDVLGGPALYLSAEDELDEINRRLRAIASAEGLRLAELEYLTIYPLAGENALLAAPERDGRLKPSVLWEALCNAVERLAPALVILDTNADFYGGNEIDRAQVRQFVSMLRGLAMRADCAIVLLSHPSVNGMTSGSGLSGSTAWNNSVRSRLYFERVRDGDRELDPDLRVLRVMKANYGPAGGDLRLRWNEGRFVAETPSAGFDKLAAAAHAERVFLDLLGKLEAQGRDVSPKPSQSHAPTIFAKHPNAEGLRKRDFADAMERLLDARRIEVETAGPPSRRHSRLVLVRREGES